MNNVDNVAPHAGAWIEILVLFRGRRRVPSLPMRGRGLKFNVSKSQFCLLIVAPHAGAWIEMAMCLIGNIFERRRSPCGSVD